MTIFHLEESNLRTRIYRQSEHGQLDQSVLDKLSQTHDTSNIITNNNINQTNKVLAQFILVPGGIPIREGGREPTCY